MSSLWRSFRSAADCVGACAPGDGRRDDPLWLAGPDLMFFAAGVERRCFLLSPPHFFPMSDREEEELETLRIILNLRIP